MNWPMSFFSQQMYLFQHFLTLTLLRFFPLPEPLPWLTESLSVLTWPWAESPLESYSAATESPPPSWLELFNSLLGTFTTSSSSSASTCSTWGCSTWPNIIKNPGILWSSSSSLPNTLLLIPKLSYFNAACSSSSLSGRLAPPPAALFFILN